MKKILIVDDSLYTLTTHSSFVEELGMEAFTAENGEEAISIYKDKSPDIVLCDIMMPEMDGYQVFEELKAIDNKVFLYFISGEMTEAAQAKAIKLGAAGFFQKPININDVQKVIDHHTQFLSNKT